MEHGTEKIAAFYKKRRRMPTIRELMALMGYQSTGATAYYAEKLIEAGYLAKDKATGTLVPGHNFGEENKVKILGLVEAGFPSVAEEELLDVMDFDEYLVPNKEASYILKVKGDSMIEAGIQPGDMVVVERRASYKPGQIVIAMIDGEYTMKYLRKKSNDYFLEPGNAKYKPIYPRESFRVEAVVTAVVRKY
ncbi:MAG TPA: transcriptional repressor LexA [Candidatus Paceibacterota bacterium]|nr:transcriptional repressor LexA [Candidatus Paceibacterota bacterium]